MEALIGIFQLKADIHNFPPITILHALDLFDKQIHPIISYGSEIWVYSNIRSTAMLMILQIVLGFKIQTRNSFMYSFIGRIAIK